MKRESFLFSLLAAPISILFTGCESDGIGHERDDEDYGMNLIGLKFKNYETVVFKHRIPETFDVKRDNCILYKPDEHSSTFYFRYRVHTIQDETLGDRGVILKDVLPEGDYPSDGLKVSFSGELNEGGSGFMPSSIVLYIDSLTIL